MHYSIYISVYLYFMMSFQNIVFWQTEITLNACSDGLSWEVQTQMYITLVALVKLQYLEKQSKGNPFILLFCFTNKAVWLLLKKSTLAVGGSKCATKLLLNLVKKEINHKNATLYTFSSYRLNASCNLGKYQHDLWNIKPQQYIVYFIYISHLGKCPQI